MHSHWIPARLRQGKAEVKKNQNKDMVTVITCVRADLIVFGMCLIWILTVSIVVSYSKVRMLLFLDCLSKFSDGNDLPPLVSLVACTYCFFFFDL